MTGALVIAICICISWPAQLNIALMTQLSSLTKESTVRSPHSMYPSFDSELKGLTDASAPGKVDLQI